MEKPADCNSDSLRQMRGKWCSQWSSIQCSWFLSPLLKKLIIIIGSICQRNPTFYPESVHQSFAPEHILLHPRYFETVSYSHHNMLLLYDYCSSGAVLGGKSTIYILPIKSPRTRKYHSTLFSFRMSRSPNATSERHRITPTLHIYSLKMHLLPVS